MNPSDVATILASLAFLPAQPTPPVGGATRRTGTLPDSGVRDGGCKQRTLLRGGAAKSLPHSWRVSACATRKPPLGVV